MKTTIFAAALAACLFGVGCSSKTTVNVNVDNTNAAAANVNTEQPLGTAADASAEDPGKAAEAVVADLYKLHDAQKGPFFQTKNRALVDKYFTKSLADLIWNDAVTSKGGEGVLDSDPLYNTQDPDIKNFAVGTAKVKGTTAAVPVTFTNGGIKNSLVFNLVNSNNAWKINDISYGSGLTLRKWFKDAADANVPASDTNFEGKYLVGETSCIIKPVKMGFEVRWAKGSGSEMFFSKGSTTFETSSDATANRFVFDDEGYSTGKFIRKDGTVFPVKRAE